jgi:hypothetical protein
VKTVKIKRVIILGGACEMSKLIFTADWHGEMPAGLKTVDGDVLVNLGDHPGTPTFELFKETYYLTYNVSKKWHESGELTAEKVPVAMLTAPEVREALQSWRELNARFGNEITATDEEVTRDLLFNERGERYAHFGAYRRKLPLEVQRQLFGDAVTRLEAMRTFYSSCNAWKKVIVTGNTDAGFFDCFDKSIVGETEVKPLLAPSVDRYADEPLWLSGTDYVLFLVPFYNLERYGQKYWTESLPTLLYTEKMRGGYKPLIVTMHGA